MALLSQQHTEVKHNMNINYKGYVEITVGKHKHVIHNAGTSVLFRFIAQILSGSSFDTRCTPTYIELAEGLSSATNEDVQLTNTLLYTPLLISKQPELKTYEDGSTLWAVVVTSTLSRDNIHVILDPVNINYHLVLTDGYKYPLAVIDLTDESVADLDSGQDALIQWNICFDNIKESST